MRTKRPGLELVISAHKSVAELGVIGRAEDMHQIMDAERDATLAYLDDLTQRMGGRRGRAAVRTPTEGLIYATTRHATSRAGDPGPHDHVLLANLVRMDDDKGGWKAADTALWREHLHAATMVGRMASARGPSSWATASSPTTGRREALATGPSPACPRRSWTSTPSGRRRSRPRCGAPATTPTRPATSPPGPPGRPSATARWRCSCPAGVAEIGESAGAWTPSPRRSTGRRPSALRPSPDGQRRRGPPARRPGAGPRRRPGRPQGVHPPGRGRGRGPRALRP